MRIEFECYWGIFYLHSKDSDTLPQIYLYNIDHDYIGLIMGLDLFTIDLEKDFEKLEEAIGDLVNDDDEDDWDEEE